MEGSEHRHCVVTSLKVGKTACACLRIEWENGIMSYMQRSYKHTFLKLGGQDRFHNGDGKRARITADFSNLGTLSNWPLMIFLPTANKCVILSRELGVDQRLAGDENRLCCKAKPN